MQIENFINIKFLTKSLFCRKLLPALSLLFLVIANFYVFVVVPNEQVMGAVQRIFYFHVGAAFASYLMLGLLLFASALYLASRKIEWDVLACSSALMAFVLCSVVLITGMIWGHSSWNTWWRWEPRLVSFLVLWLILFSYLMLRSFTEDDYRQARFAAVVGILAAVNVPIVIFSIKLLDHREQLHPEVVASQGLKDPRFVYGLLIAMAAVIVVSIWLMLVNATNLVLERKIKYLQANL